MHLNTSAIFRTENVATKSLFDLSQFHNVSMVFKGTEFIQSRDINLTITNQLNKRCTKQMLGKQVIMQHGKQISHFLFNTSQPSLERACFSSVSPLKAPPHSM